MSVSQASSRDVAKPISPRKINAQNILDFLWGAPPATAGELMEYTGLTRATVLSLCKELENLGWLKSAEDTRRAGEYAMGRPAKRYVFNPDKAYIVGVDAGEHHISATVANLSGYELGSSRRSYESWESQAQRREQILKVIEQAIYLAEIEEDRIHSVVIGVPAPVNEEGASPSDSFGRFWLMMNPDLRKLEENKSWKICVDNDANLAALADLRSDPILKNASFATLLAGERIGAGIVLNGQLLRQKRGMAGEMAILNIVNGVETTDGVTARAREAGKKAIKNAWSVPTTLSKWKIGLLQAEDVFAEAERGDAVSQEIINQLADILARTCAVLAGPLDLDRVNLSGGAATAFRGKTRLVFDKVQKYINAPWLEISTSNIGEEAVRLGAVYAAIDRVRESALDDF